MKYRLILLGFLIIGIIVFPVVYNFTVIKSRIYSVINYYVEGENSEEIINKVELFNYTGYLINYFEGDPDYKSYIDRDFVMDLQNRIISDTNFHWELLYSHSLEYSFIASNYSKLYLTYNNDTIFSVKDQNNNSLLSIENYPLWQEFTFYLNFTQLGYVYMNNSTILLNNTYFIELYLDYSYYCGSLCGLWYSIQQFLVVNMMFDVLMIFIPYAAPIVS
ncbi:MAG: hypothetical protein P8Y23_14370 [Candidatus Lokiarchaeota archaeon]|jgi:hypothetical protein